MFALNFAAVRAVATESSDDERGVERDDERGEHDDPSAARALKLHGVVAGTPISYPPRRSVGRVDSPCR